MCVRARVCVRVCVCVCVCMYVCRVPVRVPVYLLQLAVGLRKKFTAFRRLRVFLFLLSRSISRYCLQSFFDTKYYLSCTAVPASPTYTMSAGCTTDLGDFQTCSTTCVLPLVRVAGGRTYDPFTLACYDPTQYLMLL